MKTVTLTVRIPQRVAADIARESRERKVSKSDVVRERLTRDKVEAAPSSSGLEDIADLIGTVGDMPDDVSSRVKYYLRKTGFGKAKYADYSKFRR